MVGGLGTRISHFAGAIRTGHALSAAEVKRQLTTLGIKGLVLGSGEVRVLPSILKEHEQICAFAYGLTDSGRAAIIATNERLLFIDKRFYHCRCDEITYDTVGATDYERNLFTTDLTIDYRGGTLKLSKVFKQQAASLISYIDSRIENRHQSGQSAL